MRPVSLGEFRASQPENENRWMPPSMMGANMETSTSCRSSASATDPGRNLLLPAKALLVLRPQVVPTASVQPGISPLTRASSLPAFLIRFGLGQSSSSAMVPVPSPLRIVALTGVFRTTAKISPVSKRVSPFTEMVRVVLVAPAGMDPEPLVTAV